MEQKIKNGEAVEKAAENLRERLDVSGAGISLVLGSGIVFDEDGSGMIETSSIPGYPVSTVKGHKGTVSAVQCCGKKILVFSGRIHYYEGYTYEETVFPVDLMHVLGVKHLILTNAAGGIDRSAAPGSVMILDGFTAPFSSVYSKVIRQPFDPELSDLMYRSAVKTGLKAGRGTYAYMTGPSFETPAEIRYLEKAGAGAVGMSTVPEAVRADELGITTGAVSRIANFAAGITGKPLSHEEVLENAGAPDISFVSFLKEIVKSL